MTIKSAKTAASPITSADKEGDCNGQIHDLASRTTPETVRDDISDDDGDGDDCFNEEEDDDCRETTGIKIEQDVSDDAMEEEEKFESSSRSLASRRGRKKQRSRRDFRVSSLALAGLPSRPIPPCDDDDSSSGGEIFGGNSEYIRLCTDVFTIIFYSPVKSLPFVFAMTIFVIQIVILCLIMIDLFGDNENIHIPSGVSPAVRASQFLAILIAVATQDDLMTAIKLLYNGYSPAATDHRILVTDELGGGACWQWMLSVTCRAAEGLLCLMATFMLIMQSDEVTGMFVDFLAVSFVSTIDNVAFQLASEGFFGNTVKKEVREVMRVRVPKDFADRHWVRPLVFLVILAAMLAGWGIIAFQQMSGKYISCQSLYLQFGDEFYSHLGFYSGLYKFSNIDGKGRGIYMAASGIGALRGAQISYCTPLNAWTFSFASVEGGDVDPCDWQARTRESNKYDVLQIPPSEWLVPNTESIGAKRGVPPRYFTLQCDDCQGSEGVGSCQTEGTCVNNECICHDGWFGLDCQFSSPCPTVEVDTASAVGYWAPQEWAGVYHILRRGDEAGTMVIIHERPVYIREYEPGKHRLIVFTGRRWFITSTMIHLMDNISEGDFAEFLTTTFRSVFTSVTPVFISSPVDSHSPSDRPDPTYLQWFHPDAYGRNMTQKHLSANLSPTQTRVRCTMCDDATNPCRYGGICTPNGTCACGNGTYGTLCQITTFDVCQNMSVSVVVPSDLEDAEMRLFVASFSGIYDLADSPNVGYRPMHVNTNGRGALAFCFEGQFWALIESAAVADDAADGDTRGGRGPCLDWVARSARSFSNDVLATEGWVVRQQRQPSNSSQVVETTPLSFILSCTGDRSVGSVFFHGT